MTDDAMRRLLDGLHQEVLEAIIEGDAQDCTSPDCIADAVYEIARVRFRDYLAALSAPAGLDVLERCAECDAPADAGVHDDVETCEAVRGPCLYPARHHRYQAATPGGLSHDR